MSNQFHRLIDKDGDVSFTDDIRFHESFDSIFEELVLHTSWEQPSIQFRHGPVLVPRLTAWYGDRGCGYTYSGIYNEPMPWTDTLFNMRMVLEQNLSTVFNSVLINFYRHGNDSIGFHSDDEKELGFDPTIASVSLGGTRIFVFKHKIIKGSRSIKLPLTHGRIVVMKGSTQNHWVHGIKKELNSFPRINLTFRNVLSRQS